MTHEADNLLVALGDSNAGLTRSEQRVAEVILDDPRAATRMSIATLAQKASVSEPTVNRFCRKFEPQGYPAFKLRLAQSLVLGVPYVSSTVSPDDDTATVSDKILDAAMASLRGVRSQLDPVVVERVVDSLLSAKRLFFVGAGVSSAVARDAEQHFFRFALPIAATGDALMQRMQAASAEPGDLYFMISHTGRTRDIVDIAQLALGRGAEVIALTAQGSPLARVSALSIELDVQEDTDAYMPMTSRIAQLAVLDVLAAGVTLRCGDSLQPRLRAIKQAARATRYVAQGEGAK
ncbi:MAG: transcriptional regulator HexR [Halieaceae bacterium]|jgi:RpiR family carbohydrate utilization transcriptional regulator|nr:transcriptional regulator HexR [Halieaceae bacterium]